MPELDVDGRYQPAVLESRIKTVEAGLKSLEADIHGVGQALGAQISALNAKLDERAKPQWTVLIGLVGTLMTFGAMIGGMGYLIVKSTTDHLEADIRRLDTADTRQLARVEFDTFRINNNTAIRDLRENMVQKDQFEARWHQYEVTHRDLQERVAAIALRSQEAINAITLRLNTGFTIKDAIKGMTQKPN